MTKSETFGEMEERNEYDTKQKSFISIVDIATNLNKVFIFCM